MQRWYTGAKRGQWMALLAALLGWAFDGFEMGVFPIVARPALIELLDLQEEAKLSKESTDEKVQAEAKAKLDEPIRKWNGILTVVFLVGASLGGLFFGWIGDRVGRVRAMIFSVLTYAIFTGCCGFVGAAWQLAALRFLAALGMGGEWSLGVALVMETWGSHARPVLAGLIGAAANVGFACTGLLSLVIQPDEYWRIFLMICVFPAGLTFVLRMFVPESEKWEQAVASGPKAGIGDIFVPQLRRRSLMGAALGAVALLGTWGAVQLVPFWVGQQMTTTKNAVSYAVICSSLGAVVGAFSGAFLGQHLPRRLCYLTLCVLSLLVCEFCFLTRTEFDWTLKLTLVLVGACTAAFYGLFPLYLPELFPTRVRAAGQGFCYNFGRSLAAVGVLVTTFAIDLKGKYHVAGALVCTVYVVGMVLVWFAPETKDQPLPE